MPISGRRVAITPGSATRNKVTPANAGDPSLDLRTVIDVTEEHGFTYPAGTRLFQSADIVVGSKNDAITFLGPNLAAVSSAALNRNKMLFDGAIDHLKGRIRGRNIELFECGDPGTAIVGRVGAPNAWGTPQWPLQPIPAADGGTLAASISDTATSLTLTAGQGAAKYGSATYPITVRIGNENIYVTGRTTDTLTGLIRGQDGTTASSHASSSVVAWITFTSTEAGNLGEYAVKMAIPPLGGTSATPGASKEKLTGRMMYEGSEAAAYDRNSPKSYRCGTNVFWAAAPPYTAVTLNGSISAGASTFKIASSQSDQLPTFGENFSVLIDNEAIFCTSRIGDTCYITTRNSTLASSVNASDMTLILSTTSDVPPEDFVITIGTEDILIASAIRNVPASGQSTLTADTRGYNGTTATSHAAAAAVTFYGRGYRNTTPASHADGATILRYGNYEIDTLARFYGDRKTFFAGGVGNRVIHQDPSKTTWVTPPVDGITLLRSNNLLHQAGIDTGAEEQMLGWDSTPGTQSGGNAPTFVTNGNIPRSGNRCFLISYNDATLSTASDDNVIADAAFTLAAGTYYATCWVYVTSSWHAGSTIQLSIENFVGATGTLTGNATMATRDAYQQIVAGPFTIVGGDTSGNFRIRLLTPQANNVGESFRLDDCAIVNAAQGRPSPSSALVAQVDGTFQGLPLRPVYNPDLTVIEGDPVWDAKGDLAVGTGADTATRLAVGTSLTHRLIADSTQTTGLKWVPHIIARTADSSAKTNSTLASDDTLLWAVAANETWQFQAFLLFSGANATMDEKIGWSVPAGVTMQWGAVGGTGDVVAGFGPTVTANTPIAVLTESGTLTNGSLNGVNGVAIAGLVFVGATAGNVNLQWAQNTTDAGNLKLLKGSSLTLWRQA